VTRAREKANLTQKVTTSEPTQLTNGMIWLDTDAVAVSQQSMRWTKTPSGGTTVLSGASDSSITLSYSVGQEQVYANGVLQIRGSDYTASDGTSITLASASVAGDVFEVISIIPLTLVDTYTQTQADGKFVNNTLADAKGDLIVGTADNTISKLTAGSNGQSLVADSTTTSGLRWQDSVTAGKNAVINGDFSIWQRGTSRTGAGGGAYTADRWFLYAGGQITVTRQTTGDTTNLPNIQYCARVQRNSGSTDTTGYSLSQPFETLDSVRFAGQTVTFSFYARRGANYSATSNILGLYLVSGTGTDQNQQVSGYTGQALPINNLSATLTTTWQRFTYTAAVPTNSTEIAPIFVHIPTGTAGSNDYFEVTGVQLEVGSVATPFSRATGTIAAELAACQRYYWRITADNAGDFIAAGMANSTTEVAAIVHFPQTLRTIPTAMEFSGVGWVVPSVADYGFSAANFTSNTPNATRVNLTGGSGLTATRPGFLRFDAIGSFISASAEL
jgi:hypothetical protein